VGAAPRACEVIESHCSVPERALQPQTAASIGSIHTNLGPGLELTDSSSAEPRDVAGDVGARETAVTVKVIASGDLRPPRSSNTHAAAGDSAGLVDMRE
jgi:hypothetical protein